MLISCPVIERVISFLLCQESLYLYAPSSGQSPNHLDVGHCTRVGGTAPIYPLADLPLYTRPFNIFTMVQCPGLKVWSRLPRLLMYFAQLFSHHKMRKNKQKHQPGPSKASAQSPA